MKNLVFSPRAQVDLDEIWVYTANHWDIGQADFYVRGIVDACLAGARGSRIGRNADDIRPGYSKIAIVSNVVFYKESALEIDVVRVLHQRMDLPAHLD